MTTQPRARFLGVGVSRRHAGVLLAVVFSLVPAAARAADPPTERIKHAVFLVRPHYHDQTRELFSGFSDQLRLAARQTTDRDQAQQLEALAQVYRGHADSPGHGSGWLVRDADGAAWVVTNEHVVGQAEHVTLEWEIRAYRPIERCPVVYVDPRYDLAVIAVPPDALPPGAHGFELELAPTTEGTDVSAAGFPSAFQRPTYQYTVGIVNNARFEMPDGQRAIHHSASIDPGSSGGPLLVSAPDTALGFRVLGVNTWGHLGRANVNLSIPASEAARALDAAREAWALRRDMPRLNAELNRTAQRLARELGSGTPDVDQLYRLMSYEMVARRGDRIFDLIFQGVGSMSPDQLDAFLMRPVEFMRREMFGLFVMNYRPSEIAGIRLEEVYDDDFERLEDRQTVRTVYSVSGHREEVHWVFEHGSWKIADATFSRPRPVQQARPPAETARREAAPPPPRQPGPGAQVIEADEAMAQSPPARPGSRGVAVQLFAGLGPRQSAGTLLEGTDPVAATGTGLLALADLPLGSFLGVQLGLGTTLKGASFSFWTEGVPVEVQETVRYLAVPAMARLDLPVTGRSSTFRLNLRTGLGANIVTSRTGTVTAGSQTSSLTGPGATWFDEHAPFNLSYLVGGGMEIGAGPSPTLLFGFSVLGDFHMLDEWTETKWSGSNFRYRNWYVGVHLSYQTWSLSP